MKRPNPFLYIPLGFLLKVFAIFKGQKITKKLKIKGPAIVLSNHTSFYDFVYTTAALYPRRVSYLAASKMFLEDATKVFLKMARAIPKSLMQADPVATLKAFRILKKKGIVSVFPEGQISPSGKTLKPAYSIAKFLKKANVDIYIVKHLGAGLVNPPWSKKTFKGRIETEKFLLIQKEELSHLSTDDIYLKVCEALHFSPSEFIRKNAFTYRLNTISNLENVIYQCPKCLHEGLIAHKHHLLCPKCSYELHYDSHGLINDKGLDELFLDQENRVRQAVENDKHLFIQGKTKLMSFHDNKLQLVGEGILKLEPFSYTYEGTIHGDMKKLTFKVENTPTLPSDIGRNVQIYEGYQIYQFEMEIPWLPTKFVHIGEYLYDILEKNKQV